jgi:hypothetical protein
LLSVALHGQLVRAEIWVAYSDYLWLLRHRSPWTLLLSTKQCPSSNNDDVLQKNTKPTILPKHHKLIRIIAFPPFILLLRPFLAITILEFEACTHRKEIPSPRTVLASLKNASVALYIIIKYLHFCKLLLCVSTVRNISFQQDQVLIKASFILKLTVFPTIDKPRIHRKQYFHF